MPTALGHRGEATYLLYASDGHQEYRTWAAAWPDLHLLGIVRLVEQLGRSNVRDVYTSHGEGHCSGIISIKETEALVQHTIVVLMATARVIDTQKRYV